MEDIIGIVLEHAGPIGAGLSAVAFYLAYRLRLLPTRARIEWVEPEPMQEQAKQLVQVGQRMQSSEGKQRRTVHPIVVREKHTLTVIKGRSGGNEAA